MDLIYPIKLGYTERHYYAIHFLFSKNPIYSHKIWYRVLFCCFNFLLWFEILIWKAPRRLTVSFAKPGKTKLRALFISSESHEISIIYNYSFRNGQSQRWLEEDTIIVVSHQSILQLSFRWRITSVFDMGYSKKQFKVY